MQFVSTENPGDSCADPSLDSPEPEAAKPWGLRYPDQPRHIHCNGTRHLCDPRPKEVRFSRRVIWLALFGKKKALPVNAILTDRWCPYAEVDEDWRNDATPVDLGPDYSPFFGTLLDIEGSLA
jgi:hypothetical protein